MHRHAALRTLATAAALTLATACHSDGTASGAVAADQENASRWCGSHLPKDLGATHRGCLRALVGGCMDGVLPDCLSPKDPSLYF